MSKGKALALLLGTTVLLGVGASGAGAATPTHRVLSLTLTGVVDPFMTSYVKRGISTAEADGDSAVLLTIDTPGGLLSSEHEITKAILAAKVPVICYTAPEGARAASAGTFIMLACPVNAMAPGTNIGAAHPVGVSGVIENEKVTNDAAASIRALATRWHRNADWAGRAVRDAISASAEEAASLGVVDLVAPTPSALLSAVGGCSQPERTFTTGELSTTGPLPGVCPNAAIQPFGMSLSESFFHGFADPNVAFLFINIGFLALIAWIFHPGFHASLAVGIVALALGFVILEALPVRLTGVLLLLLAAALFVLDVKATAHGVLTAGGAAVLILGGLLLFNPTVPSARVSIPLILAVAAGFVLFSIFVLGALVEAKRAPVATGMEWLRGAEGIALSAIDPAGRVRARHETWTAESESGPIPEGATVRVVRVRGVTLIVAPAGAQIEEPAGSQGSEQEMSPVGSRRGGVGGSSSEAKPSDSPPPTQGEAP